MAPQSAESGRHKLLGGALDRSAGYARPITKGIRNFKRTKPTIDPTHPHFSIRKLSSYGSWSLGFSPATSSPLPPSPPAAPVVASGRHSRHLWPQATLLRRLMSRAGLDVPPKGGFSFDLCRRNEMLVEKGLKPSSFLKTGTTIVGLVFEDGVVLGADTRATEGPIVADKNCEKIHFMAPNIYCCGAGTAADTEAVTDMVSSQLQLHRYATGRESRVVTALTLLKSHLFSHQGHVSAALVLGGVDVTGPHLHTIYPHGSTDTLPYATMGSGSLAAMSVFESKYSERLTKDEGIKLVCEAICSGIFNDLGSGSNVDVCVITKDHVEYLRNYQLPNPRTYISSRGYSFNKGQTEVLSTKITPLKQKAVALAAEGDLMEE